MIDFNSVIKKFGTPTYLYDTNTLLKRISYLKSKLDKKINLIYAVKANTFIVKELDMAVDGFEICSKGEYDVCDKLLISDKKMIISGVNKDYSFIEKLVSTKNIYKYTIESLEHFKMLEELSLKYNKNINCLIRLTSGNQFGVSEDDFKFICSNKKNINIVGIQYFSGTQKHSLKKIDKEFNYLKDFIISIEDEFNIKLEEVEYGPGFPIYYFLDDEFSEDSFLDEFSKMLDCFKGKVLSLEIGRSIASSCGFYLTKVVDIKSNKNGNYVIVDGGINHIVYYGQVMAMKIPHLELLPKKDGKLNNYNICGSLCTTNDILIKNINLRELSLGDVFVFKNVGAYSSTEGISLFLSRDLPKVVIRDKNNNLNLVRDAYATSKLNCPNYNNYKE